MKRMSKKALDRMHRTIVLVLMLILVGAILFQSGKLKWFDTEQDTEVQVATFESTYRASTTLDDTTDISRAIRILLSETDSDFRDDLPLDESFFYWIANTYGKGTVCNMAYDVYEFGAHKSVWVDHTGCTVLTLYANYCMEKNYATYTLSNVSVAEGDGTIAVVGDVNLDDSWSTMQTLNGRQLSTVIDPTLLSLLNEASVCFVNNEFAFVTDGEPLLGKAYTFGSNPANVDLLLDMGCDLASLGNNHVYDFGEAGLLETMSVLTDNGIEYVGAGADLSEAMTPQYYIIDGKKVAFVSATQVEINLRYTREATDLSAGVLKTLDSTKFVSVIEEAERNSDYVVVYVHWGWEGRLYPDEDQLELAQDFIDAGADVIIGNHAHRLQGATFIDDVPVVYSLGNFWMTTGSLFTSIAQLSFDEQGRIQVQMIPCLQTAEGTIYLEDSTRFYEYVADLSEHVAISRDGILYRPMEEPDCVYFSEMNYSTHAPNFDVNGENIDNVGNLE